MSWYAVENISEAFEDTKELLWPFNAGIWLRLALIVALTGGFSGGIGVPTGPSGDYNGYNSSIQYQDFQSINSTPAITGLATGLTAPRIIAIAAVVLALFIGMLIVTSVFEFIYYQSLLNDDVRIRKNFRKHFKNGLRYLGFRLSVAVALIAVILGLVLGLMALSLGNAVSIVLAVFVVLILALPIAVILGLVNNFVLPRMIESEEGILDAISSVYPDLRSQWQEVGVYIILRLILSMVGGVIAVTTFGIAFIVLAIPFIIVGIVLAAIWIPLVAIPAVVGIIVAITMLLLVSVPVQTYMRYYALANYHDLTA